jgi:hypothetical protein
MATPFDLQFADISTRVMNNLRLPVTNLTEQTKVNALINEVYRDLWLKHDWWFLVKFKAINTSPVISSGTVDVTQNSTTITFSTAPQQYSANVSILNYVLTIPAQANDPSAVYRIAAHTSGATTATLDTAYTDVTATGLAFNVYQDKYALPVDCGKVLGVTRYGEYHPMQRIGVEVMQQMKQADVTENRPQMYTVYDFVTSGDPTTQRWLWIHPYPDKPYRMDVYYKQQLNTEASCTDEVMVPDEYRQLLIYGTLARGYPIFHKDLERGKFFQALFNDLLALAVAQHKEYASDKSAVIPQDGYRRGQRRPRTAYTLGNLFDRLPNRY